MAKRQFLVGMLAGAILVAAVLALFMVAMQHDFVAGVRSSAGGTPTVALHVSPTSTRAESPLAMQAPTGSAAAPSASVGPVTPTPTSDAPDAALRPGWQQYRDARFGFSLAYPPDWFVYEHDKGVTITSQEMTCGSCQVLPPDIVIVSVELSPSRPDEPGESVTIGKDAYSASMIVDESDGLSIRIYYMAMAYDWLLKAEFGEGIDLNSPEVSVVGAMLDSLHHFSPVSPAQLPGPTSVSPPVADEDYLSPEYVNAEPAIRAAYREAGGDPDSPLGSHYVIPERIQALTLLYHIATADLGYFNGDTSGFYEWVVEFFKMEQNSPSDLNFNELRNHVAMQIRIATSDPSSPLGKRIRQLEAGQDPTFPGSGPEVYWDYLFHPFWTLLSYPTDQQYQLAQGEFDYLVRNRDGRTDFGRFLTENGDMIWVALNWEY